MALFTLAHMYPDLLNLYGDRGNLICLKKRLEWQGHQCQVVPIALGQPLDFKKIDFLFMGGGSDREQGLVYEDLIEKADGLMAQIEGGFPMVCVCGAYQFLGQYYRTLEGQKLRGLGLFNFHTQGEKGRLIGNVVIETCLHDRRQTIVGFENHGGRTYLEDKNLKPLGRVLKGFGNNGKDGWEGIRYKNLFGTYLHGPLLPKNPALSDYLLGIMASRRNVKLEPALDDTIENYAHREVEKKLLGSKV